MKRVTLLLPCLFAVACHPLSLFAPPRIKTGETLNLYELHPEPQHPLDILLDERGVPHIYANTEDDLAYGLGFMHGRDRLFQVLLLKHAAYGRLTELFGKDLLPVDRRLRLISWKLDEAFAALDPRDVQLLQAYARGINAAASQVGRSAEMFVLRTGEPHFEAKDALAIARFQSWQLSADFNDELLRLRLSAHLPKDDPRLALLFAPAPTQGVSILSAPAAASTPSAPPEALASLGQKLAAPSTLAPVAQSVSDALGLELGGASNSWVVSGTRTASGKPILSNDPHLAHGFPSVFYLAHLEHPDFTVVGATFPGIPVVLIGHTRHLAWGMTTSYADTQDLLRLESPAGQPEQYLLDGTAHAFETSEQTFRFGQSESAPKMTETWRSTPLGPMLPLVFSREGEAALPFALSWAGFRAEPNRRIVSGFYDFYRAQNVAQAREALSSLAIAAQNVTLAFTNGDIAYHMAAYAYARPFGVNGRLPRTVTRTEEAWGAPLPLENTPHVINPQAGYVVTANQRVLPDGDARVTAVGETGVPPHRALRIHERLDTLLASKRATADEVLAIQSDIVSTEARVLAPILGRECPAQAPPHDAAQVQAFCAAVKAFDGRFTTQSRSALPYLLLLTHLRREVVRSLGETDEKEVVRQARMLPMQNIVETALRFGPSSPLFARSVSSTAPDLKGMLAAAVSASLHELHAQFGTHPQSWRYGAWHQLTVKSQLAAAPLIGGFFKGPTKEQPGQGNTIRAENGLPVEHGSALRMVVELTDTPRGRFVIDSGQSGHPREPHAFDQFDDWNAVHPRPIVTERGAVEAHTVARISLSPHVESKNEVNRASLP
ncbi:MAG: penicillin acylase family protein [Myxococcaceae bacterium]|nr:penicillin acylase family protein [Myxococcaceae bacterium]